MSKLPENIQNIFDNLTGFQKTYCEYRSKGLSQSVSAEKAGSNSQDKQALASVGYSIEQLPGVKDYLAYLKEERAKVLPVDELEIIGKLREVYRDAMTAGKYKDANVALELMGTIIGLFGHGKTGVKATIPAEHARNNTDAFKDEGMEGTQQARMLKVQAMMKDLSNNK